ncbi:MAG: aminomethyl-transferring glycine dehydrogenase [Rhodobacteraceae bacterium]|nr:aminomethyl-transferring glycine dehydrogenase [Paracoccaceae bacterium]
MKSGGGYSPYDFARLRHIGPDPREIAEMLSTVGFSTVDELIESVIPASLERARHRFSETGELGAAMTEHQVLVRLREIAHRNSTFVSLIGMGYHGTLLPTVIQRNVLENPAWYTAYTPYQPEISQGRLQVLLTFQTMVCDLTGMEVANASLLDEATACAEAMLMARRIVRARHNTFFVDEACHPQNIAVLRTRAEPLGIRVKVGSMDDLAGEASLFGAIFQYPGTCGDVRDLSPHVERVRQAGGIAAVSADPLALTVVKEPGAMGADICVGSVQRFGTPPGYGGPHAGYIATREKYIRQLPGRIVGISRDSRGQTAYRLALQTREQHIRRQRATSNICTAQVLPAVIACLYGVYHGRDGLTAIAQRIHSAAVTLRERLEAGGYEVGPDALFDTLRVDVGAKRDGIISRAKAQALNFRVIDDATIGISLDEMTDLDIVERICASFEVEPPDHLPSDRRGIPQDLRRKSRFMRHRVFNMNRSEASLTRYIRRLADRDLALDRTMIPLGSCTMKLNATTEMLPLSWHRFTHVHPYVPDDQVQGYLELLDDLERMLCALTGFSRFSMQPNSGAQGEFAGLMAIRKFHRSNGESDRNVCLIPKSAHGTNAASAVLAGMKVVEIDTCEDGTIDTQHLENLARRHGGKIAATMVTYPSTHGVFEESINDVVRITHDAGGQVYMDGANFNAMVGLVRPAKLGVDVSHLNLHKTFCIPHGGGGPGMGPIGVRKHLIPFLPTDPLAGDTVIGAVSGSRFGSASILTISWAYILMMGGRGLELATTLAILSANYVAKRLSRRFSICYAGKNGLVAHECIVDTRRTVAGTDLSVDHIAKRIIDNGIHPPTMSFPVAGTLMVEPTESETKAELDRFITAMLEIADDVHAIRKGQYEPGSDPLSNAPHTMNDMLGKWDRPYSRRQGAMPHGVSGTDKYWPPVNRVDNVYGDRNLNCVLKP